MTSLSLNIASHFYIAGDSQLNPPRIKLLRNFSLTALNIVATMLKRNREEFYNYTKYIAIPKSNLFHMHSKIISPATAIQSPNLYINVCTHTYT